MRHLTIRNVPDTVATALEREKRARGTSLNRTVIDILSRGLGVGTGQPSNGLRRLAGRWTEDEHRRFQEAIRTTEQIDEELWR